MVRVGELLGKFPDLSFNTVKRVETGMLPVLVDADHLFAFHHPAVACE